MRDMYLLRQLVSQRIVVLCYETVCFAVGVMEGNMTDMVTTSYLRQMVPFAQTHRSCIALVHNWFEEVEPYILQTQTVGKSRLRKKT